MVNTTIQFRINEEPMVNMLSVSLKRKNRGESQCCDNVSQGSMDYLLTFNKVIRFHVRFLCFHLCCRIDLMIKVHYFIELPYIKPNILNDFTALEEA